MRRHALTAALVVTSVACGGGRAPASSAGDSGDTHSASQHEEHTAAHGFKDPAKWSKTFDAADRDAWQKPDEVIGLLALPDNAIVADVGAATGYFAMRIARARPNGTVYAIDIEPEMVQYVSDRAQKEHVSNIRALITTPDHPDVPEPVDLILMVDTAHHIPDRAAYFDAIEDVLKPDGRVAIIDFKMDAPMGPPKSERLDVEALDHDLHKAGFVLDKAHPLPYQVFRVYKRKP